ncbi:MAG: sugar phosphate isomerase/epimerase [Planctomycetia bacterium]|nr:sugar phosphate isomerase/epimerase [Planctomycetia bacterium]
MITLTRRDLLLGFAGCLPFLAGGRPTTFAAYEAGKPGRRLGIVIHSYGLRGKDKASQFGDPLVFLEYCRTLGAAGVQTSLGARDDAYVEKIRGALRASGMYLEGIVRLPRAAADIDRFSDELRTARDCGAKVVRTVLLDSRRYETFNSLDAFRAFSEECDSRLRLAKPIAERHDVRLAVENHKDWRADDLLKIIRRADSPQIGVCLDTGNSIALLEEPHEVVEALAPLTFTTHFKDMAVAEYPQGFLLSEVPLGTGFLDLARIVKLLADQRREIRLNLEMITRDPLRVPCLSPGYWTTFADLPARHLAATLELVRRNAAKQALPQIADKGSAEQLAYEDANVRQCLTWARERL